MRRTTAMHAARALERGALRSGSSIESVAAHFNIQPQEILHALQSRVIGKARLARIARKMRGAK